MAALAISALEAYRPPVEAIDDIDWFTNEAPSEMGEGSSCGAMLERASRERELTIVDPTYMHGKRPGSSGDGSYGRSLSGAAWEEWVPDPSMPARKDGERGYMRLVWAEKPEQTPATIEGGIGLSQIIATEMARNVEEVLALMPGRLRELVIVHHTSRQYGQTMRHVFGQNVRIAYLAQVARAAFRVALDSGETAEATVRTWLEGVALRFKESKGRPGESGVIVATRRESARELAAAYVAFEVARDRIALDDQVRLMFGPNLPAAAKEEAEKEARKAIDRGHHYSRRYPHHSRARHARRLSAAGP